LPLGDVLAVADQVLDVLAAFHARNVIHRDIKPENILIYEGEAMVADFGIALAANVAQARRITGTGLGLAISRELARGMGGDLWAESEVGVGSRFILVLRRAGADATDSGDDGTGENRRVENDRPSVAQTD